MKSLREMSKYLLFVLIIFNISQCIFMLDKYYLPESLCNHNISCIAIGAEVEYKGKTQPEISLLTEGSFWYFPDTDNQDLTRGWVQTPAEGTASFRRNFFDDQNECLRYGRNDSKIREFMLINFENNELVYDKFDAVDKTLSMSAYSLLAHPVFNESKIKSDAKIDATYNAFPHIVVFQGENYFVIELNHTEDCLTKAKHFGPMKISEIVGNVGWTHVTSAVFDNKTKSLYIFQSDQVFIYSTAFIDNRGKYSEITPESKGNIREKFFDCKKPPPIDLPTEQSIVSDIDNTSDESQSQSSEFPEPEMSSQNDISVSTTEEGKKKSLLPIIIIGIIVAIIIALLICCFCVLCLTKNKKNSSEDKESGLKDQIQSEKEAKPDSKESIEGFSKTPNIPSVPSKSKTESEEKITPNVMDIDKDKNDIIYQDIENMQIRTPDDDEVVLTEGNADVIQLPQNEEKTDKPENVKLEPSEPESTDTDKEKKDNIQDSAQPSPDQLWAYPSSAKSTDSVKSPDSQPKSADSQPKSADSQPKSADSQPKSADSQPKSADSEPKPTDSSDHSVKNTESEESKSGSQTSLSSVQSIGSIDSMEKNKPKTEETKPKSDPNSKEFKKPEDSSSSDSSKPADTTPKDNSISPKTESSKGEPIRTSSEESLTDDTEIF